MIEYIPTSRRALAARTQADVTSLTAPGKYRFGPGLYLQVSSPEAKSWIYRFVVRRKERFMGVGSARDVTLAQARKRVDELRINQVSQKIDPIAKRRAAAEDQAKALARAITFREAAKRYVTAHEEEWRSPKHRLIWPASLERYAFPTIGDVPASSITVSHVVDVLRPIWIEKAETARRLRGRIEAVLDFAADPNDANYRNPASAMAQLKKALPKLGKARRPTRHAALPYDEAPAFINSLWGRADGVAALALEFTILTAARTSEVLDARWSEIDHIAEVWTVPAKRMKGGLEHRVPLSEAALQVLHRARTLHNGHIVFPSRPFDRPLSSAAMLAVLKRMNRADLTVHGFRATFRTWAAERTAFPREVAEAALAHVVGNNVERAYQRGDLFAKRRGLMDAWATFCAGQ